MVLHSKKPLWKKTAFLGVFLSLAMICSYIETLIPFDFGIPGIKLGLANIVTLFALAALGRREAFLVMILRITLGCIFSGGVSTLIYSLSGGLCCYVVMCAAYKLLKNDLIWAVSALGGVAHNVGQIAAARFIMGTNGVFLYLLVLVVSGIMTGIFTGLCAYYVLKNRHISEFTEKQK